MMERVYYLQLHALGEGCDRCFKLHIYTCMFVWVSSYCEH